MRASLNRIGIIGAAAGIIAAGAYGTPTHRYVDSDRMMQPKPLKVDSSALFEKSGTKKGKRHHRRNWRKQWDIWKDGVQSRTVKQQFVGIDYADNELRVMALYAGSEDEGRA